MPLKKHDSTVVLEILSAFGVVAIITIAFILFQISSELKSANTMSAKAPVSQSAAALDPTIIKNIEGGFQQLGQGVGQNFQGLDNLTFFTQKLLAKNFSEEEVQAMVAEYDAAIKAAQEKAQADAAAQANGQEAEAQAPADQAAAQ